jgi:internalin A
MHGSIRYSIALGLLLAFPAGCQKKETSQSVPAEGGGVSAAMGSLGAEPKEDPEVVAYLKRNGWSLHRELIWDHRPMICLTVVDRENPVEDITITPDAYRAIARSNTVQFLDMTRVKVTDHGLKTVAEIPQLIGIVVGGEEVTDGGLRALGQCKSLDTVVLRGTNKVTAAGIRELASLPKLQSLHLQLFTLKGSPFDAFAGSSTLQSLDLEHLDGLSDEDAKHLAKLPNLSELKLGSGPGESKLTAAGIKAIVDGRLPPKFQFDPKLIDDDVLTSLVAKGWLYGPTPPGVVEKRPATAGEVKIIALDGSRVTDKGLRSVLDCANTASLHLRRTGVTDETLERMAGFKKLEYLSLERTKVTAAGLNAVSALPIRHLSMEGCVLSQDHFKAFGKMAALEVLWLSETEMEPDWLKHIAKLPKLRELNLRQAAFDNSAASHVAKMPSLRTLTLNGTDLGDKGFQEVLKLPKLELLWVDRTKVSKAVYQKAKKEHPNISLQYYGYDE